MVPIGVKLWPKRRKKLIFSKKIKIFHFLGVRCEATQACMIKNLGYWLGGRTSAADSRESARIRADSARFRADPPDVRQKYFSAESAERPANVRRTPAESARIRADPRGLRGELAEEFTR